MRVIVDGVSKTYIDRAHTVHALDGIDLTVESEEFAAVVGPSGCGKSTLLNLIAGLLTPSAGAIWLDGELPPARTATAMVFQEFALFPWRTAQANIEFGLEEMGVPAAERARRARTFIEVAGLAGFEARYPHQLSGGMRQRVGIARALAVRPAILLMDEPLSALDSQTRELLMEDFIRLLADGSMGAVYVTHNLEEAVRLADRIVVLSRRPGRVREVVTIPMTRDERGDINARGKLLALQNELWSRIREEAIDAEREVQHA